MVTTAKVSKVWNEGMFSKDYRVEPCKNFPYTRVIVPWNRRYQPYMDWCIEIFGPKPTSSSDSPIGLHHRWYPGIDCFYFRDESDVVLFMLKFSGQ